ncbi:hypothetical protein DPMN_104309 [Dreissena polymorpha]|uniref:Uncharacterized protein n=1 Tax=Dreissena polymorpha TaxID=45954 RepID=A0A9D4K1J2_DREPO|nr:hypothetical protein DPMN_104309 [Dreissena polymorpha]
MVSLNPTEHPKSGNGPAQCCTMGTIDFSSYSSVFKMLGNLGWRSLENRRSDS